MEQWRDHASEIRMKVLDNLAYYVDRFSAKRLLQVLWSTRPRTLKPRGKSFTEYFGIAASRT